MPDLEEVYEEIRADPFWEHLRLPGIKLVPGFGPRQPKVMIVGEAPGAQENARERPFCGPSGRVLHQLMELAGLRTEPRTEEYPGHGDKTDPEPLIEPANAFITNTVKYRPPGNRTPSYAEILHAREGFKQERYKAGFKKEVDTSLPEGAGSLRREWMALGRPRLIVCVGGVAHSAMHPMGWMGVSNVAGTVPPHQNKGVWISSQYHPAFGMRKGPGMQAKMERDWESLGEWIKEEGIL